MQVRLATNNPSPQIRGRTLFGNVSWTLITLSAIETGFSSDNHRSSARSRRLVHKNYCAEIKANVFETEVLVQQLAVFFSRHNMRDSCEAHNLLAPSSTLAAFRLWTAGK
jgi:hypothetical protein